MGADQAAAFDNALHPHCTPKRILWGAVFFEDTAKRLN